MAKWRNKPFVKQLQLTNKRPNVVQKQPKMQSQIKSRVVILGMTRPNSGSESIVQTTSQVIRNK